MAGGIYRLIFANTSGSYIGQSNNIDRRYKEHIYQLKNGSSSKKLYEAFIKYGVPQVEVLIECSVSEMSEYEQKYIDLYDTIKQGFNSINIFGSTIGLQGPEHGSAKYNKEDILNLVQILVDNPTLTYLEISNQLGISKYVVAQIAGLKSHSWLSVEYPKLYNSLLYLKDTRLSLIGTGLDKRSSASTGIVHPKVVSPDNTVHTILNVRKFCRDHDLHNGNMTEVLKGRRKSHKGWKVCPEERV